MKVTLPAETPVTKPALETVAFVASLLIHVPPVVGDKVIVLPMHTDDPALTTGKALTVIVAVAEHPELLVKVITLVPAEPAVTRPVLLTVATPVEADTHGFEFAAVPDPVSWVVNPAQTESVPVIVGSALTVTGEVVLLQPVEV